MRSTPGFRHVEAWAYELTLGGKLLEADRPGCFHEAKIAERECRRLVRVAEQTHATKARKRARRWEKARQAKTRQLYCEWIGDLLERFNIAEAGDLTYDVVHTVFAKAKATAREWVTRNAFAYA